MSEKKSTFSVTCSLLSQFIREKRSLGELGLLDVASNPQEQAKGLFRPATTMSLLPGVGVPAENQTGTGHATKSVGMFPHQSSFRDADKKNVTKGPEKPQLTIFYEGKVLVFDNFPPERANELMKLAAKGSAEPAPPPPASRPSSPVPAQPTPPELPMPIARRASLHRFFEKRKDRVTSKAPYQVNCNSSSLAESSKADYNSSPVAESSKAEQTRSWLGLGQETSNSSSSSEVKGDKTLM